MVTAPAGRPEALLLDMDGTLVDTEDLWWQAETALFSEWGHRLDEASRLQVAGGPMGRVVDHLLGATGVDVAPAELAAHITERFLLRLADSVPLMPGAEELLLMAADAGIPIALVSASERHVLDLIAAAIGPRHFAVTVSGAELPRNKPHADPYLAALTALGADPRHCVAVEDSITGVLAAEAAGCPVVVVPSVSAIEPAPRRTVLASLSQIDLALLQRLAG